MTAFSFRVRIKRSPEDTINIDESKWEWQIGENNPSIILCAQKKDETIKKSGIWILKSDGWTSEAEAHKAANKCIGALALTLVRLRIGADFGNRTPKSGFTHHGLSRLEGKSGQRILNDVHGLMVYETEPPPRFVSFNVGGLMLAKSQSQFEKVFSHALALNRVLTERERLSLELFNTSFFQKSNESRFLLLIMAIEALLEPPPRSSASASHVDSLIDATHSCEQLSPEEKESLLGSLQWLRNESIRSTGCKLAETLHGRNYMNKDAQTFFKYCYDLRSALAHGKSPFPSQQEIGSVISPLVTYVSDVLSGDLREVQLP
jgi:hypothetical protein